LTTLPARKPPSWLRGGDVLDAVELAQRLDVVVVEHHRPVGGQAGVGLAGALAPQEHRVGREAGHLLADAGAQRAAERHHQHEDRQAEEHAERGERGAQLVPGQAGRDLVEAVDVDHVPSRIASTGLIRAAE
jgi:hypothetical protein